MTLPPYRQTLLIVLAGAVCWLRTGALEAEEPPSRVADKSPAPAAAESEIARLERVIAGMREAGQRIEKDDSGRQTQQIQERVIKELEKLLELLKQQQQSQSQNPDRPQQNSNQRQNQQQNRQRGLSRQQLDPQNSGGRRDSQKKGQPGEQGDETKSRESTERRDAPRPPQDDEARRQRIIKDVWGHLPPSVRESMQTSFNERYLPRYEELVKRYYEALAEKNRKRPQDGRPSGL